MLDNLRMSDVIAQRIGDLILAGEISSGTQLRQEELAARLEVSRIPVREALLQLENNGLAVQLDTRRVYAADLNGQRLQEIFSLAADLEWTLLRSAGREQLREAALEPDGGAAFHRCLYRSAENSCLRQYLKNLYYYYIRYALTREAADLSAVLTALEEPSDERLGEAVAGYFSQLADTVSRYRKE